MPEIRKFQTLHESIQNTRFLRLGPIALRQRLVKRRPQLRGSELYDVSH